VHENVENQIKVGKIAHANFEDVNMTHTNRFSSRRSFTSRMAFLKEHKLKIAVILVLIITLGFVIF